MKKILFICFLLGCFPFLKAQEYNYQNLSVGFDKKDADFYQFEKLRLYPIRANSSFLKHQKNIGKYTPLQKALTNKNILITEVKADSSLSNNRQNNMLADTIGVIERNRTTNRQNNIRNNERRRTINQRQNNSYLPPQQRNNAYAPQQRNGETVNTLTIQNTSKDTIYIMAGEIIQGGKQDRVIAQDIILPPLMTTPIDLPVFCVEQGRWNYGDEENKDSKSFKKYYGTASLKLRAKVEQNKDQQAVWSEVRRSNNENNTQTNTQAYTAQTNSKYFQEKNKKYIDYFQNIFLKNNKDIIGVVVVTGNEVVGCDMFASPDLFQSQIQSLLTSYVNEAITDGKEIGVDPEKVKEYMDNLLSNNQSKQDEFLEKKGKKFKHKNVNLRISTF